MTANTCPRCHEPNPITALVESNIDGMYLAIFVCAPCEKAAGDLPGHTVTPIETLAAM